MPTVLLSASVFDYDTKQLTCTLRTLIEVFEATRHVGPPTLLPCQDLSRLGRKNDELSQTYSSGSGMELSCAWIPILVISPHTSCHCRQVK